MGNFLCDKWVLKISLTISLNLNENTNQRITVQWIEEMEITVNMVHGCVNCTSTICLVPDSMKCFETRSWGR